MAANVCSASKWCALVAALALVAGAVACLALLLAGHAIAPNQTVAPPAPAPASPLQVPSAHDGSNRTGGARPPAAGPTKDAAAAANEFLVTEQMGNNEVKMIDADQMSLMEHQLEWVIVQMTRSCRPLYDHLANTTESRQWLAHQGARLMLNFALFLDDHLNNDLLELMLRQ